VVDGEEFQVGVVDLAGDAQDIAPGDLVADTVESAAFWQR